MLDYGYRSKCCSAPISVAFKLVQNSRQKTKQKKMIWVCTKCNSRDVPIVPKGDVQNQR